MISFVSIPTRSCVVRLQQQLLHKLVSSDITEEADSSCEAADLFSGGAWIQSGRNNADNTVKFSDLETIHTSYSEAC
jgi:hypothetical protein